MTLREMSVLYTDSAAVLHARIAELRLAAREEQDQEAARRLRLRIRDLTPLWREMRELAALTARYYERGYRRHEKYTL